MFPPNGTPPGLKLVLENANLSRSPELEEVARRFVLSGGKNFDEYHKALAKNRLNQGRDR